MIAIAYAEFYGVGGIARYLDSFLSNLPASHPGVIVICGDENRAPRDYPKVKMVHLPYTSSRLGKLIWGYKAKRLLLRLYREKIIDAVNFHFPPLIPGLFIPSEIPMILTAHTTYLGMSGQFYPVRHFKSQWSRASVRIKMMMEKRILSRAHKVIALTQQGLEELRQYRYPGTIEVIPNGVDLGKFTPGHATAKDIDVLFSGRIERRKGSRAMVDICCRLAQADPQIRICIVGYGDDEAHVRESLAGYADNVRMVGRASFDEMVGYYDRSKVYVSTSYYEGLPGTCLEAMAMQLPVVAWDFMFYRHLLDHRTTGLLARPNDYDAMVANIRELLADPEAARELGRHARQLLARQYDWSRLAGIVSSSLRVPGHHPAYALEA